MTYANLKQAVLAVEDNNNINDSKWSDWDDASHIADTYSISNLTEEEETVLNSAIESNGATVDEDMLKAQAQANGLEKGAKFNAWR